MKIKLNTRPQSITGARSGNTERSTTSTSTRIRTNKPDSPKDNQRGCRGKLRLAAVWRAYTIVVAVVKPDHQKAPPEKARFPAKHLQKEITGKADSRNQYNQPTHLIGVNH